MMRCSTISDVVVKTVTFSVLLFLGVLSVLGDDVTFEEIRFKFTPAHVETVMIGTGAFAVPQMKWIPEKIELEKGEVLLKNCTPRSIWRQAEINMIRKLYVSNRPEALKEGIMNLLVSGNIEDIRAFARVFKGIGHDSEVDAYVKAQLENLGIDANGRAVRKDSIVLLANEDGNAFEKLCAAFVAEGREGVLARANEKLSDSTTSVREALLAAEFFRGSHRGCLVDHDKAVEFCRFAKARASETGVDSSAIDALIGEIRQSQQNQKHQLERFELDQAMQKRQQLQMATELVKQMTSQSTAVQNPQNTRRMPSGSSYKRRCSVHGVEYDIRFPTGCPACSQPDYGSGKTQTCPRHGCFLVNGICPQCR